jgi:CubicO group peptidase (beta-lactamase class C family)
VKYSQQYPGSFHYAKAFGSTSMKPSSNAKPLQLDTVMWFASCTKLMTAICAMQLVERGQLDLDDPVYEILPELRSKTVITGLTDDAQVPIEEPHKKTITLRHLLSHSSGLTYDHIYNEKINAWLKHSNLKPLLHSKTIQERFQHPLIFEPGEAWAYGPGIDFAGLMVERVTGMSLEAYMKKNLWDPLGIRDATFHLSSRPDMHARLADMSRRSEDGKAVHADELMYLDENGNEFEECFGGHGSFTTAEEYIKVLRAVLVCGAGGGKHSGGILKKESVDELTKSQLSEASKKHINALRKHPLVRGIPFFLFLDLASSRSRSRRRLTCS